MDPQVLHFRFPLRCGLSTALIRQRRRPFKRNADKGLPTGPVNRSLGSCSADHVQMAVAAVVRLAPTKRHAMLPWDIIPGARATARATATATGAGAGPRNPADRTCVSAFPSLGLIAVVSVAIGRSDIISRRLSRAVGCRQQSAAGDNRLPSTTYSISSDFLVRSNGHLATGRALTSSDQP
jgi:hypothetical protein